METILSTYSYMVQIQSKDRLTMLHLKLSPLFSVDICEGCNHITICIYIPELKKRLCSNCLSDILFILEAYVGD